jgi:pyruvate dehydrogenase (quinone)
MPPTITLEQATGFGVFMLKAVPSRRGDEIVDVPKVNLFRQLGNVPNATRHR